jgi:hypothetical protein
MVFSVNKNSLYSLSLTKILIKIPLFHLTSRKQQRAYLRYIKPVLPDKDKGREWHDKQQREGYGV